MIDFRPAFAPSLADEKCFLSSKVPVKNQCWLLNPTSERKVLSPCQCRMARAAVGLSRPELAAKANISVATLADFELGKRTPYERTLRDVKKVLRELGVTFLDNNDDGEGVRMKNDK